MPTRSDFRAKPKGDERVSTFNVQYDEKECEQPLEGAGDPNRYAFFLSGACVDVTPSAKPAGKEPHGPIGDKDTPIPIANARRHVASNDRTLIALR